MKRKKIETLEDLLGDASFARWVSGEADAYTPFWEEWISEDARRKEMVEMAKAIIKGIPFQIEEPALAPNSLVVEWEKLKKHTKIDATGPQPGPGNQRLRVRSRRLRIAATLALLVLCGFLMEYFVFNPRVELRTPYGKQLTLVLPDSTVVDLNANSVLTYRKRNPRKVRLSGEAFFRVKKKITTGANFLVITNDLTVEVLGTAFNVFEKADKTEVVLEEGSVKLNLKRDFEQELLMKPGELVTFSARANENVEKRTVQAAKVSSWKDGVLEFDDVQLSEIMQRIEAIYGWKAIYYDESLKNRKITLGLPSDDLESAIVILSKSMNIQIEKVQSEGNVLLLR